jgi:hypothetical protein
VNYPKTRHESKKPRGIDVVHKEFNSNIKGILRSNLGLIQIVTLKAESPLPTGGPIISQKGFPSNPRLALAPSQLESLRQPHQYQQKQ